MITHQVEKSTPVTAAKKTARGKCIVYQCRRVAARDRHVCHTCRDRMWRAAHPEHHLWNNLKKSARKRGVEFTLTVDEFKEFCRENNFVAKVGRGPEDATVDRRDPRQGYHKGNLRVLSNVENATIGGKLSFTGHRNKGQEHFDFQAVIEPELSTVYSESENPLF